MDPLNNYYPYPFPPQMAPTDYLYNVVPATFESNYIAYHQSKPPTATENGITETVEPNNLIPNQENTEEDSKANIQLLLPEKKGQYKKKGKTSDYWVKKMQDKEFPFYGCTICNISFPKIEELDKHVFIHEGRLTSYDIRMYNRKKKKEKLKQLKKMKKLSKALKKEGVKIEKEILPMDIEIKPEDGYIGNEKATEYNENKDSNNEQNNDADKKTVKKVMTKYGETTDPRLHKLFQCFACQKQFSLSYYLRLHVRSHLDEKPYVCATCGQSFITASKLGRHNKRIHLAVRFQCRVCFKNFSKFEMLKKHFDKKHEDAKLAEGEPYDYNAILPYLKELEEQLKQKELEKEKKPKTEDVWGMGDVLKIELEVERETENENKVDDKDVLDTKDIKPDENNDAHFVFGDRLFPMKHENDTSEPRQEFEKIVVEVPCQVKVERDEQDGQFDDNFDTHDVPSGDNSSDEEYFPEKTWAEPPKVETDLDDEPMKPKRRRNAKTSEFPKKCEFCDKTIKTKQYYKVHLRIHTGEKPFKCCICDTGFVTRSKMYRHVMTHDNWQEKCNEADIKPEKIKEEGKEEGEEDSKEGVKKRRRRKGKQIKSEGGVKPKKKYGKRPNRCRYCHKTFLHLDTLEVHKKMHEASGDQISLTCFYCVEEQPDEDTLIAHEATHVGNKPYPCTLCDKAYTAKDPLLNHRSLVHNIPLPTLTKETKASKKKSKVELICDICSKLFYNEAKLQKHIVSHSVEKYILRYECPVCAHMFHTKYHIQMHLTTHQKEGLILEENRADILAMVLQNARKIPKQGEETPNMDLIPPDERSRVCNICGEVFQHFYYLEEHLKSHGSKIVVEDESKEEERKHICPVCNKGFKLNYYLKLHSYTHVTERPYICQQCGKGFITKGKLKRHIETHSGLKKYQCHVCYKFFTRPSYLRIHVRTIHGTQDYNFRMTVASMQQRNNSVNYSAE